MTQIQQSVRGLFLEVFGQMDESDGTWFIDSEEAILQTLDNLSAAEASRVAAPGLSSIAAHVIHLTYYIELSMDHMHDVEREGDWDATWEKQEVSESEWLEVKNRLREKAMAFVEFVEERPLEGDDITYTMANVGHIAYHLGAMRQLYHLAKRAG